MITDALLQLAAWLGEFFVGLIPGLGDDQVIALYSVPGKVFEIVTAVAKFNPVIPFFEIGYALQIFLGLCLAAATVQTVRIVGSFVTLGGGGV